MRRNLKEIIEALGPDDGQGVAFYMNHPKVADFRQAGRNGYVYCDRGQMGSDGTPGKNINMSGLTNFLKIFYWPDWTPYPKTQSAQMKLLRKTSLRIEKLQKKKEAERKRELILQGEGNNALVALQNKAKSHWRGDIIHGQIGQWILMDQDHFHTYNPAGLHPGTRAFFQFLDNHQLYPFAADYIVACTDESVRLATGVDCHAVNLKTGAVVWIEVKSTVHSLRQKEFVMDRPEFPWCGKLAEVAEEWNRAHPNSPLARSDLNRAKIQLAMSYFMGWESLGPEFDVYETELYVIQVPENGKNVCRYRLTEAFLNTVAHPVYLDLKKQIPLERARQAAEEKGQQMEEEEREEPARKKQKMDTSDYYF